MKNNKLKKKIMGRKICKFEMKMRERGKNCNEETSDIKNERDKNELLIKKHRNCMNHFKAI